MHELGELRGRTADNYRALRDEKIPHLRRFEDTIDLCIELNKEPRAKSAGY